MTKPLVIYHADCADGFGAAFAACLKLGDEAEYLPMQYGDRRLETGEYIIKDVAERTIYILDFSFPRSVMESLFRDAKSVVWLDHHKTAFEMWCGKYEEGMFYMAAEENDPRIKIHLNDNKSGALLAWEFFHPGTDVPLLIQHIDDRDRWQFKLKGSKEVHAAMTSYQPWSFEQWEGWHRAGICGLEGEFNFYAEGAAILRAQNAAVAQAVKHARTCHVAVPGEYGDGEYGVLPFVRRGLAISCPLHQSEIGHELANKSGTFGLVWYMGDDGRINISLRSNGDYDVSAIAKAFGGGGHRNAAGFQTDLQTLMGWLK